MSRNQENAPFIPEANPNNLVDAYRRANADVLADLIVAEYTGWNEKLTMYVWY